MKVSDEWCAHRQGVCEDGGSESQSRVCVCANFSGSVTHSLGAQGNTLPILLLPRSRTGCSTHAKVLSTGEGPFSALQIVWASPRRLL